MKLCYGVLLGVVAVCSATTPQDSPLPERYCRTSYEYSNVWNMGEKCLEHAAAPETLHLFNKAHSIENLRVFFDAYCRRHSVVRQCLTEVLTRFKTCQNDKLVRLFEIYRNGVETLLDVGCVDGGGKLATFFDGLFRFMMKGHTDAEVQKAYVKCAKIPSVVFDAVDSANVDLASTVYILYKQVPKFMECVSKLQLEQPFGDVADWFVGELVRTAKCVAPQGGALVECGSIVPSQLQSSTPCDVIATSSVYDAIEAMAVRCFREEMELLDYVHGAGMEVLRDDFGNYCGRIKYVCLTKAPLFAEICLDETQRNEFRVVVDSMKRAVVSACSEDGRPAVDIMYEVYRLNAESGGRDLLRDCVEVAKATRKQGGSSVVAKNLRFYDETVTFKGCLLDKLSGNPKSVVAATAVMEDLLNTS